MARGASCPNFLAGWTTTAASHDIWRSRPRTAGTPGPHTGLGGLLHPQGATTATRGRQGSAVDERRARGGGCGSKPHSACPVYWAPVTEEALEARGGRCREAAWRTTFCVCLEGGSGDMRLPADALGTPPREHPQAVCREHPSLRHKAMEIPTVIYSLAVPSAALSLTKSRPRRVGVGWGGTPPTRALPPRPHRL